MEDTVLLQCLVEHAQVLRPVVRLPGLDLAGIEVAVKRYYLRIVLCPW